MSRTPREPIPTDAAVNYVRDVLEQAAQPVEVALALKLVGPLTGDGKGPGARHSLQGRLGRVGKAANEGDWWWELDSSAYSQPTPIGERSRGEVPTRDEADRALCTALRELGWTVLGAPE